MQWLARLLSVLKDASNHAFLSIHAIPEIRAGCPELSPPVEGFAFGEK